jgi:hypothetical protein
MSDASSGYGSEQVIGSGLSEDDRNVLRTWRESQALLDSRYDAKVLLQLVARSLADDEFRSRLLNDTASVLADLEPALAEGLELRFLVNTQSTLHVVLPTPTLMPRNRSGALGEALRSRTSGDAPFEAVDDWDIKDDEVDPPITKPPKPPFPGVDDAGKDDAVA